MWGATGCPANDRTARYELDRRRVLCNCELRQIRNRECPAPLNNTKSLSPAENDSCGHTQIVLMVCGAVWKHRKKTIDLERTDRKMRVEIYIEALVSRGRYVCQGTRA